VQRPPQPGLPAGPSDGILVRVKESRPELKHFAVFPSGSDDPVPGLGMGSSKDRGSDCCRAEREHGSCGV
jgi:hypothetical protein